MTVSGNDGCWADYVNGIYVWNGNLNGKKVFSKTGTPLSIKWMNNGGLRWSVMHTSIYCGGSFNETPEDSVPYGNPADVENAVLTSGETSCAILTKSTYITPEGFVP